MKGAAVQWQTISGLGTELQLDGDFQLRINNYSELQLLDATQTAMHFESITHRAVALYKNSSGCLFVIGADKVSVLPIKTADDSWWNAFKVDSRIKLADDEILPAAGALP